jgi:hypothetical protein
MVHVVLEVRGSDFIGLSYCLSGSLRQGRRLYLTDVRLRTCLDRYCIHLLLAPSCLGKDVLFLSRVVV